MYSAISTQIHNDCLCVWKMSKIISGMQLNRIFVDSRNDKRKTTYLRGFVCFKQSIKPQAFPDIHALDNEHLTFEEIIGQIIKKNFNVLH